MMKYSQPVRTLVAILLLAIFVKRGSYAQLEQLEQAVPDAGTTIAQFADDSTNLTFFCLVTRNGTQLVTDWQFLTEVNRDMGLNPATIVTSNQNFLLSGDNIGLPSNTNLTVLGLTPDLNNLTLFCGFDTILAQFTIIVYDHPSIPINLTATATVSDVITTISWEPPSNLGSPKVAYYSLVISDDSGNVVSDVSLPASGLTEFNATDLLPLTNYSIELTAVSQVNPVLVISPVAELNFTTNTSVPLVNCTDIRVTADKTSVKIDWDNIHTGGLELISASIEYALLNSSDNTTTSANFTPVVNQMVNLRESRAILEALPTVGLEYVFQVTTENSEGESTPSQCPVIFLEIGAPSTPDTPIAEANGPVALLTLRTEDAGLGDLPQLFAFSVLVYTLNSTDNTSRQFVREDVLFNSSDHISGESVVVHVEDVMELNQLYQFAARAVNMFGVSELSDLSDPVLLNVSEPVISMVELETGADGITVFWSFLHTGGSDIDQVEILLMTDGSTVHRNTSRSSDNTFLIGGELLQAGVSYQVGVRASNEFGVSDLTLSETLESTVGAPAVPRVPTLFASTRTSITLTLHTPATGLVGQGENLTFRLRVTATDDATGITQAPFELTMSFPATRSEVTVQMTVRDVDSSVSYVFSVRAENRFGSSAYSGDSERVSPDEGETDGLETQELIGIVVGAAIVVVMITLCCILIMCALVSRGGNSKSEVDGGNELQDNSLYHRHQKNENRQQEEEFSPEAFESQYEPPPDEDQSVPLQPKPTHSTLVLQQPQPLYDTLNPSERLSFAASIGSGREQPNPLYSGTPASSRPTSQLQDSGTGTVNGSKMDEHLYSEANTPQSNNGVVYSELDHHASQASLNSTPPPPPDPRRIPKDPSPPALPDLPNNPMYAEAGSGVGSQEHLYSELPDPRHHDGAPHTHTHSPIFHVPPPPSSNENLAERSSISLAGSKTESDVKTDML